MEPTSNVPLQLEAELPAGRLHALLDRGATGFVLLDVRNDTEVAAWRIEGRHQPAVTVNRPYFDFLEDEEAAVAALEPHRELPIVVVCAKGGSSDYVAGLLRERGFAASNLVGGMQAWGDLIVEVDVPTGTSLVLKQLQRVGKGCLAYVVADGGQALVVDPHRHLGPYEDLAARLGVHITHVFDTHLHADHISGARVLAERSRAVYMLEAHDAEGAKFPYQAITPGQTLRLGQTEVQLMPLHTPGHTPGSASLLIDGRFLLSGDTLFVASIGRPDLGGQLEVWGRMLYRTLGPGGELSQLPDDVLILPAHYAGVEEVRADGLVAGTLGMLREHNPALRLASEEAFVAFLRANQREAPAIYQEIRRVNLAWQEVDEARASELDLGKNECAASRGGGCATRQTRTGA
ncbi:MAG: MBL fold metallo-hydrolase [Candidatus Sericytochromatia bacterium]|nr:MBL fold metallo-hydrolase [Candidatus Sericytochromatia bacterium]